MKFDKLKGGLFRLQRIQKNTFFITLLSMFGSMYTSSFPLLSSITSAATWRSGTQGATQPALESAPRYRRELCRKRCSNSRTRSRACTVRLSRSRRMTGPAERIAPSRIWKYAMNTYLKKHNHPARVFFLTVAERTARNGWFAVVLAIPRPVTLGADFFTCM